MDSVATEIFKPFRLFSWDQGVKPKPFGNSRREAEQVAWLLSCSPWLDGPTATNASSALGYVCHLRREHDDFESLHGKIHASKTQLVHMDEIEAAIHGTWCEKDLWSGSYVKRMDPYFYKLLQDELAKSLLSYMSQLDAAISSLSNAAPLQTSAAVNKSMQMMIRSLCFYLTNALLKKETTEDELCQLVSTTCTNYIQNHVADVKRNLKQQVGRVRSLAKLAACEDRDLDCVMQVEQVDVIELFADPPPELVDQLQDRNIAFSELYDIFCPSSNDMVSTQVAPASFAVRASTLSRFLCRHRDAIQEVCTNTIVTLQGVHNYSFDSQEWHRVELCLSREAAPVDEDHIARWTPPPHLGKLPVSRSIIAQKAPTHVGLRSARLSSILTQQIRAGLLPVATMSSTILIPIISRIASEADVAYAHTVEHSLRPLATKYGIPWPEEINGTARTSGTAPSKRHQCLPLSKKPVWNDHVPSRAPSRADQCQSYQPCNSRPLEIHKVPAALQRDQIIMYGLCVLLKSYKTTLNATFTLDDIMESVRSVGPMLSTQSDASLRQAVRWVCCEVIKRCDSQEIQFSSTRDRTAGGKVGGIVCYDRGAELLFNFTSWCVTEMSQNGEEFVKTWRVSRSSRAKAVRVAREARSY